MYVPNHFREDDTEKLHQYIRDYGFGLLVTADDEGIEANHVPFHLSMEADDSLGTLQCHLARSNPVWQRIQNGEAVLAIFQGPDAYVSPSWYPTKAETGRVVPTWNYLAVHVEGSARVIQDPVWLKEHVRQLTDQHEKGRAQPWAVDDAPTDFTERLVQGIVGVEVKIKKLTGKLKASQNQPERNQAGVKDGLKGEHAPRSDAMSGFIG
ncbi:FMN-binding negative transcriptional regulator [Marinobacter arenosus]|uniref:FMN-binding negative transcriptional regulator n=1 Tax=Marinobacter arenosus TaxID=2856822 RepID=UPI001C4BA212|nr:FMN-binding negative transcriptional regulator [Marinobacter arenosus]MBW0148041.1 FMN-binding negative transcriptional regulator [Marinobacter arenosus]